VSEGWLAVCVVERCAGGCRWLGMRELGGEEAVWVRFENGQIWLKKGRRGLRVFCDTAVGFKEWPFGKMSNARSLLAVLGAKTGRSRSGLSCLGLGRAAGQRQRAGTICTKSLDRSTRGLPREKETGGR
jgi:hypothetical protein